MKSFWESVKEEATEELENVEEPLADRRGEDKELTEDSDEQTTRKESEEFLDEACSKDHVKEEDRMDSSFPLDGDMLVDRERLPRLLPVDCRDTISLATLLSSTSDFIRIQALCGLKERTNGGQSDEFKSIPNIINTLTDLILNTKNSTLKRLAAMLIATLAKNYDLRKHLLNENGVEIVTKLLRVLTSKDQEVDHGPVTRALVFKFMDNATKNDLNFTGFLITNFDLNLFSLLDNSNDDAFKINILQLMKNILHHPSGLDALIRMENFNLLPLLKALTSLVPEYHNISFHILDLLLRYSRSPYQEWIHSFFLQEHGVTRLSNLIHETYLLEPKVALNCLLLFDHLADGRQSLHVLVCTAFNLLKSIIFYDNKITPGTNSMSQTKWKNVLGKPKKDEKFLPDSVKDIVNDSMEIDKYNIPNATVYDLPLDPIFIADSDIIDVRRASKNNAEALKRKTDKHKKRPTNKINLFQKPSPIVRLCDKRAEWRIDTSCLYLGKLPEVTEISKKIISPSFQQDAIENSLKIIAVEVFSKLASHKQGSKLMTNFIRNVCPLLKKYKGDSRICESVGYSLQLLIRNCSENLNDLLPYYYLVRELVRSIGAQTESNAKSSILGALATLLQKSCSSVYGVTNYGIRLPVHCWLKITPEYASAHTSLNALIIIYNLARIYKCRDFIMSKTVVTNLFRIIQSSKTEDICKIYAVCSLAFLTFANKRYREFGKKNFSFYGPDQEKTEDYFPGLGMDYDPNGPFPTINSFLSAQVNDDLFAQPGERGTRSPCNLFIIFLMNLLIQRSPRFWSSYVFTHHTSLMKWLIESIEERQALAQNLYATIMSEIPTLSFYQHNMIYPWSKIDEEDFYTCVEKDEYQSFPQLLANKSDDVSPIYCVYKLSKSEKAYPFPWEKYWTERYELQKNEISYPRFCSSVLADSIFGFGALYRGNNEACLAYPKQIKVLRPQITEKYFIYHPIKNENRIIEKLASTYTRSLAPSTYSNLYFKNRQEHLNSPKQIILPNLYRYQKHISQNLPFCHRQAERFEVPGHYFLNDIKHKKKHCNTIKKISQVIFKKFFKSHKKTFSKYQFRLLLMKLINPPGWWAGIEDGKYKDHKRLKKLMSMFKHFPNSLLEILNLPYLQLLHTRSTNDLHETETLSKEMSPYEEAANTILTIILEMYEKLSGYSYSSFKNQERIVCRNSQKMSWYEDKILPLYATPNKWNKQLGDYGKALINTLEKTFNDKFIQCLLTYSFPFHFGSWRRYGSIHKPRRSSGSMSNIRLTLMRSTVLNHADEPNRSQTLTEKYRLQRDGLEKYFKSPDSNKFQANTKRLTLDNVYLPTSAELISDMFFQPASIELRGFHSCSQVDSSETDMHKQSTLTGVLSDETAMSKAKSRVRIEIENIRLKKEIDYIYQSFTKPGIYKPDDNTPSGVLLFSQYIRPERVPDFQEFCEFVETGILDIFEKDKISCWYADVLKFIAKCVCQRLEGPFGIVDDHIMFLHRQELKRLLGTSIIPFGRLQIGGQLERAILFKFFADQFMIPCGLHRGGISRAWVEVPYHPFLFPKHGTCIVDLDKTPGTLIEEDSTEANDYKGYSTKNIIDEFWIKQYEFDTETSTEYISPEITSLGVKEKDKSEHQQKKGIIRTPKPNIVERSLFSEYTEDTFLKNKDKSTSDSLKPTSCPFPLSEEHFRGKKTPELSYLEDQDALTSSSYSVVENNKTAKKEHLPPTLEVPNENYIKFSWKPDPEEKYTIIIGDVPDNAFSRYSVGGMKQGTEKVSHACHQNKVKINFTNTNPLYYSPTTAEEVLNDLSSNPSNFYVGVEKITPVRSHIPNNEIETDEYFKKWEEVITNFNQSNNENFHN